MSLNRRTFAKSIAAASALAAMPHGHATDATPAKLTLSAPLTHSDWMLKPNIPAGVEGVRHMLDACKAAGWSHVYWRAFDAGQATYASKLLKPGERADEDNFYNPQTDEDRATLKKYFPNVTPEHAADILKRLAAIDYAQFDSLAAAIDYGHSIGLKIHAWATINEDDHGWGWQSEFSKAHPEFRWVRRDGRPYRSQLSFAFPEVREYKLGLIKELLAYDIDGLFIDWIRTGDVRDNPQTDPAGVADSGYEKPNIDILKKAYDLDPHEIPADDDRWIHIRCNPQTMFMRALRKATKLAIAVMVGHPWHYRGHLDPIAGNRAGLLLDVKTWAAEGLIDAAIAAGYYRPGGSAEAAYKALADETAGKCDLWYYAWVPNTPEEFETQFAAAQSLGAKRILHWEADYIDDRPQAAALKAAMNARAT
jgi:hypothetical protein